jgi:glycosyltransferase involved in cell wall biosynthesis
MKVVVFRAFRDPYRTSMQLYADAIERRVTPWLAAGESIVTEELPSPRLDGGWRRHWDQYVRYQRYVRSRAGDVNHIVDHGYGHLAKSLPAGRTVVTFHDAVVVKVPGVNWRTRRSFEYSLRAMTQAAAIVCVSETAKRDLQELIDVPAGRLHVIPWGIDEAFRPAADRQAARRRLGLSGDVVLMVGHTQPYMNVERMIRAFGQLVSHHGSHATLVKVGLPFTPEHARVIAELELGDHVRMVGHVPFVDLPAYYHAADVLLYAPLLAGFGLPPLEAMACGTPVVASSRGAIPEVVGDGGLLVDAEDEGAMADAMAELLSQPQRRRRLVERGFDRAARFEWTRAARALLEVYRTVARG